MSNIEFISELEQIIATRRTSGDEESYTNSLFEKGTPYIAQKVGEEAVELAIAAVLENSNDTIAESADLLYHLLVLLNSSNLKFGDVAAELENRHKK
jgi:phosphoribosyl-ATP pyrophosphohydrolase